MANATFNGYGASASEPDSRSVGSVANIIGAVISFSVLILLVGWGAKTLMRDASGVPVVQALEGPIRVAPEEPGGVPASHQGLSVNAVASNTPVVDDIPDDLRLAPQPLALTIEDQPTNLLQQQGAGIQVATVALPQPDMPTTRLTGVEQLAAQLAAASAPLSDLQPAASEAPRVITSVAAPSSQLPPTPISASLRPVSRPNAAALPVLAAPQPVETSPFNAVVPAGTPLAQLGAFDTRQGAEQQWTKVSAQFADFVAGKSPVIQTTMRDGKTWYRLRVQGFAASADSRRFCGAITAKQGACFPVVMK